MSVLHNPQWEIFTRELVELSLACDRKARAKAYERAGFAPNADNARRLANRPLIKRRFHELFAEALEYRDVRPAAIVTRIDRVGRANVADFYEDDGVTLKNIKDLPRELTEAVAGIEMQIVGEDEEGRPIRRPFVKVHDKNQANFVLLKHFGALPDDPAASRTVNMNIFSVLNVDDQRALAEALEAIPAGPPSSDREAA